MNSSLKVIFLGTPSYVDPIISELKKNFDLIKTVRSANEDLENLKNLEADLFVVASFGKIIPADILKLPKLGAINIHPSKLPLYRGPSPLQSQILDGVTDSAISFILMDDEMDHGPILLQKDFQISDEDTFESLCQKMFAESAKYISEVINGFVDGSIKPAEQDHGKATFTKLVEKENGYFDVENIPDSQTLERMTRAYYPWPGTFTKWNGKIVKFLPEGKIQMEGKNATGLKSFLNGYPDFPIKEI